MSRFRLANLQFPLSTLARPVAHGDDTLAANGTDAPWQRAFRAAAMGIAVLLLVAALGLLIGQQRFDGRIYPSVTAGDLDLGGKSLAEAQGIVQSEALKHENETVTFTFADKTWSPTYADLGIRVDVERTLNAAYGIGREETARSRISSLVYLLHARETVPLYVTVDQQKLDVWLDQVDKDLGIKPRNASLEIDGVTVEIVPEVDGTVADRERTLALVNEGASSLDVRGGELPVVPTIARVRAGDLEGAKADVESALSKPVRLKLGDKRWTVDPEELSPFLVQTIDRKKRGADAFSIALDEEKLADYLEEKIATDINRDPINATVAWSNEAGTVIPTSESRDGRILKPVTLARAVRESFWAEHETVTVPVTVLKPDVDSDNLAALGIETRLAVGDSAYYGSNDGRATNIGVGAYLLNGTLVPPGADFSFNHSIGVISEDQGFVEASVIQGERIGRDVGGGICQVSTTVFRAALLAGMPIIEWWPHTYRLGFYELDGWQPGWDASILQPDGDPFSGGDFRFKNATDSWMLIESYTQDEHVYVIIYGPKTGLNVTFSDTFIGEPIPPPDHPIETIDNELPPGSIQQSELAQEGVQVSFSRTVTDSSGNVVIEETFTTLFASRPDVWKVSPDMVGQSPASQGE